MLHEIGLIFQSKSHTYMFVERSLGQSLHDWDHEMWIFFVTGEWRSNTNRDGPILSSKFMQHCSSIPRSLSDFLDPYFHSHFFVFTQYCFLSNRLWMHNEIQKNLSVKKDSTCSFVRDMFFCAQRLCTRTNTKVSLWEFYSCFQRSISILEGQPVIQTGCQLEVLRSFSV